jgi:hypothetical protein
MNSKDKESPRRGESLAQNDLRITYLQSMRTSLKALAFIDKSNKFDQTAHLIRVLPTWGRYPWIDLNLSLDTKVKTRKSQLLYKIVLSFILTVIYFIGKYFSYLPYRTVKPQGPTKNHVAWFSPSIHLDEFLDEDIVGFWGKAKTLDLAIKRNSIWYQIPFRLPKESHLQISKQMKFINETTDYCLLPIARFCTVITVLKSTLNSFRLHKRIYDIWNSDNFHKIKPGICSLILDDLGFPIGRTVLNDSLLDAAIQHESTIKAGLTLLEGQPWELSLIHYIARSGGKVIGNIHIPLRERDTQILNHFLNDDYLFHSYPLNKIICSDLGTEEQLLRVKNPGTKLALVEAQRFFDADENFCKVLVHNFDSNQILYVEDSNFENTLLFESLVSELSSKQYRFFVKTHPASPRKLKPDFSSFSESESLEFALVIFGADTSSYLQSSYRKSNVALLSKTKGPVSATSGHLPQIDSTQDLLKAIHSTFNMESNGNTGLLQDSEFKRWRRVLNELRK